MSFTKKVVAGQDIVAADFAKFFGDHFSEFVKTGFEVSEGTGLVVDISAGTAYVKDASGYMYQIVSGATETTALADNSTNYVFLHSNNGATYITDSTSATVPDDAILLATVVTASGDVTTVTDNRVTTPLVRSLGIYSHQSTISNDGYIYINLGSNPGFNLRKLNFTIYNNCINSHTSKIYVNLNNEEIEVYSRSIAPKVGYDEEVKVDIEKSLTTVFQGYIKFTLGSNVTCTKVGFNYTVGL